MSTSVKDPRFESTFDRWNLKWEFVPELSLTDQLKVIDEAQVRSLEHIAATERVDEYALQMKGGASFPPIVLMAPDILIDGNTRTKAARKIGRTHLPAYRVKVPDLKFARMLAAALNQLGGARLSSAEANKAALNMIELGWPDDAIGRELGYAAESVRRWRREAEFQERAARLTLDRQASALTKKQRQDIAKISHDEPFAELVKLVAETKPDPADLKHLIEAVDKSPSDSDAVAAINEARTEWVPIGPAPQRVYRNRKTQQMQMHIGALLKLFAEPADVYEQSTAEKVLPRLRDLAGELEDVIRMYETSVA